MLHLKSGAALAVVAAFCACTVPQSYNAVSFRADGDRLVATGVIDATTMKRFMEARAANPNANILVLQNIPGSADDDANLLFSRAVRQAGFTTIVPSDGVVASGGTDLFLAGQKRILEDGACVGVHSWEGDGQEGGNVARSDPAHQIYLKYYDAMGIDRAFYWFTLDAAPASGIHWMTTTEVAQYDMTTAPSGQLSQGSVCNQR